jgi:hypothetical protein
LSALLPHCLCHLLLLLLLLEFGLGPAVPLVLGPGPLQCQAVLMVLAAVGEHPPSIQLALLLPLLLLEQLPL